MFKIATWNVNSLKVRLPHVVDWLKANAPDVLALQETKTQDENFPVAEIEALGYKIVFTGQKTFNGVAVFSRHALQDPVLALPGFDDPQKRLLAVTVGDVRVIDVYIPNGSEVGSDKYAYKLNWLKSLTSFVQHELLQHEKVIILGDYNIAPEDIDVHDPKAWDGSVLVSALERQAFEALLALGFHDAFRAYTEEQVFSWWDYRQGAFARNKGLRIDHILFSKAMVDSFESCYIDAAPRKLERPSDHTPVVAEFNFD